MFRKAHCIFNFCILLSVPATLLYAADVVLKIKVSNPSDFQKQTVPLKSYLPIGIKLEDITDKGGLEIGYDFEQSQYYAQQNVELDKKEEKEFLIMVKDVWLINEDDLKIIEDHVNDLMKKLETTSYKETSDKVGKNILKKTADIRKNQEENSADRVGAAVHIKIYEDNTDALSEVKADVGVLENLAIGSGLNPGQIMGEGGKGQGAGSALFNAESPERKRGNTEEKKMGFEEKGELPENVRTLELKITVSNPSETAGQNMIVKYYLPAELRARDVVDPASLEVKFDILKKTAYLYKELWLEPIEVREFIIKVVDVWQVVEEDLKMLQGHAENMLAALEGTQYADFATSAVKDVGIKAKKIKEAQEEESKKGNVSIEEHIANYRENAKKLANMKDMIIKLEKVFTEALATAGQGPGMMEKYSEAKGNDRRSGMSNPSGRGDGDGGSALGLKLLGGSIFEGKAPSASSTWKIIFIIMGFLGTISFLFFILWFSQVKKSEKKGF